MMGYYQLILILCAAYIYSTSAVGANCRGGEVWTETGSACLRTCRDPQPVCDLDPIPRCECGPERPFRHHNLCFNETECSGICKTKRGEVWNEQGSFCTKTCTVPVPVCVSTQTPRCECSAAKPYREGNKCHKTDAKQCKCRARALSVIRAETLIQENGKNYLNTHSYDNMICTGTCPTLCSPSKWKDIDVEFQSAEGDETIIKTFTIPSRCVCPPITSG